MDPILVDVAQLRSLVRGGLTLTPGRVIMARVTEAGEGARGQLAIAGGRLGATLPPGVRTGDELRLVVKEISADRVLLQIQAQAPPPLPTQEAREGDGEDESGGSAVAGTATQALQLRYETQHLGPIDLRFELHGEDALSVTVSMQPGDGLARARESAGALHAALLEAAAGGDVALAVTAQRPPLDVYV
jgi:hypothetical protein